MKRCTAAPEPGAMWRGRWAALGLLLLGTGCGESVDPGTQDAGPLLVIKVAQADSQLPPGELGRLVAVQTRGGNRLQLRSLGATHQMLDTGSTGDVTCSKVSTEPQLNSVLVYPTDGGTAVLHARLLNVSAEGGTECDSAGESLKSGTLIITPTAAAPAGSAATTPDAGTDSDTDTDGGLDAGA